ncbi:NAD(P)-binding domain-containing protein [Umezawaea sp. Da 62-37]|uniref:NAD(P)-dependent oxidoreductase n=1 Tax=Umezawaea sp. Da 62-37 TaxID=3075927 RepID=UPI0028F6F60C|nr:NAD(P)-binding domain-containing protein [Umezawaea sp. Da 62-37]WNV87794.1 NAD(P)-binding domain-containing protein [Umezawaea sp. Da 62-37]
MTELTPTTVLGLGAMGSALAEALVAAGHPTTVWNRSATRPEPRGCVRAGTVQDAVAASGLVILCLLDHGSVRDVLSTVGPLDGKTIVNLTSCAPAQARDLAAWATERGADYLDGGIMAVPPMIATPAAFVLYSGSQTAFDHARPALDRFGESHYLGTDPGSAALYDLSLLSGMYGLLAGILHAYAVIGSEGVAATSFAPLLARWLTTMVGFTASAAEQIDRGDYSVGVASSLAMQSAGFTELLELAEHNGISPELIAPLGPLMARRVADGHGHEDIIGVIELLKKGANHE